ncbi:MAG: GGDEF domain-containing protein [Firmicutes bacterium]|nr:GGDEF domain-containing protein [Bacillota bacterium]
MKEYRGIMLFYIISTVMFVLISFSNFLLFHTLVELFTVVLGILIFVISIYSRKYMNGSSFALLGIAYLFIGVFDLMHTFSFGGIGIFDYTQNITNQFFVISRLFESIILLLAFSVCFKRKLFHDGAVFFMFIIVFGISFILILEGDILPVFYSQNIGQKTIVVIIDYISVALILVSASYIYNNEKRKLTRNIILVSILLKLISILFFSLSNDFEYAAIVGHLLRYSSYIGFYFVFVRETISDPYATIFRTFRNKELELIELSQKDSLTGLFNHSTTFQKISEMIDNIGEEYHNICIMMIDIDDFKLINDKHGHQKGYDVLIEIAKIFKDCEGPLKLAGRYGGDEFVIVFSDFIEELVTYTANRIIERVSALKNKLGIEIGVSIGCAIWEIGDAAKDLVYKADLEMYKAKENGKNSFSIWHK